MRGLDRNNLRKRNRIARNSEYERLNSNDMMGAKNLVLFISTLFRYDRDNQFEELKERELIEKMKEKLREGDEEAIKFLRSKEFEKLNRDTFKFDNEDKDSIEKGIRHKGLRVEDILNDTKQNNQKDLESNKNKNTQRQVNRG